MGKRESERKGEKKNKTKVLIYKRIKLSKLGSFITVHNPDRKR